jgi:hypothetical protein
MRAVMEYVDDPSLFECTCGVRWMMSPRLADFGSEELRERRDEVSLCDSFMMRRAMAGAAAKGTS